MSDLLYTAENGYFRFEDDFVEAGIRCIPMIVRYKLDACGIKLKLAEWSCMTPAERSRLATAACETDADVHHYRHELHDMIWTRTGNHPSEIPVPVNPAWSQTTEIPPSISEALTKYGKSLSLWQWQTLRVLQRFALYKLSQAGHEHTNFLRAMEEFGLLENEEPGLRAGQRSSS